MNKYQKEISREIKDIMRSDHWHKMTYKEARRKWRSGIRAFLVDNHTDSWVAGNFHHLGLSRSRLRELGRAYRKIIMYCAERNLHVHFYHDPPLDYMTIRFSGWSLSGQKYSIAHNIHGVQIRQFAGSLEYITNYILEKVNNELRECCFPSPIRSDIFELSRNAINPYYGEKILINPPVGIVRVSKGE